MKNPRQPHALTRLIVGALFLGAFAASASPAGAGGFRSMAKELSAAAKRAGRPRIAVLPFVPSDGSHAKDGWSVSEKLVTQLVRTGKVQAVERSLLEKLFEEHRLGRSGALDDSKLKSIGRMFAVDAVITGSFVTLGPEVLINARLIDVETGLILAASERRAERDWFEAFGADARETLTIPAPEFTVAPPAIFSSDDPPSRDALAEASCDEAAERVDRLESRILEIKARYWALKLRSGFSIAKLTRNPGSTISDPELKRRFYERLRSWYAQAAVPELTAAEVQRFVALDSEAFFLHRKCGI